MGVIQALWNYIKVQGLQDKVDRRVIRADEYLKPVCYFRLYMYFFTESLPDIGRGFHAVPTYS